MLMPLCRLQEHVAAGRRGREPSHHVPPREERSHAPNSGAAGGSRRKELSMGGPRREGVGVQRGGVWDGVHGGHCITLLSPSAPRSSQPPA